MNAQATKATCDKIDETDKLYWLLQNCVFPAPTSTKVSKYFSRPFDRFFRLKKIKAFKTALDSLKTFRTLKMFYNAAQTPCVGGGPITVSRNQLRNWYQDYIRCHGERIARPGFFGSFSSPLKSGCRAYASAAKEDADAYVADVFANKNKDDILVSEWLAYHSQTERKVTIMATTEGFETCSGRWIVGKPVSGCTDPNFTGFDNLQPLVVKRWSGLKGDPIKCAFKDGLIEEDNSLCKNPRSTAPSVFSTCDKLAWSTTRAWSLKCIRWKTLDGRVCSDGPCKLQPKSLYGSIML